MEKEIDLSLVTRHAPDIVARDIAGELIIIPLSAGTGELEEVLYTLSGSGKEIWDSINGERSLREVALEVSQSYEHTALELIEADVLGLTLELLERRLVICK